MAQDALVLGLFRLGKPLGGMEARRIVLRARKRWEIAWYTGHRTTNLTMEVVEWRRLKQQAKQQ